MALSAALVLLPLAAASGCLGGHGACPSSVGQGLLQASRNSGREMLAEQALSETTEKLVQGHQVDLKDIGKYAEGLAVTMAGHNHTMSKSEETALEIIRQMVGKMQNASNVEHAEDQAEVERMRDLIQNCSSDAAVSLDAIAAHKALVNASRGAHATCRSDEGAAKVDKDVACSTYDSFRKSSTPPSCMSTDLTAAYLKATELTKKTLMETCLDATRSWLSPLYAKYDSCRSKTEVHKNISTGCNTKQHAFEQAFCSYQSKLEDTCDTQTTCRMRTIAARNSSHDGVILSEAARKSDFAAGKFIVCLMEVFDANNSHKHETLLRCQNLTVSTSMYDIQYPDIPIATGCMKEPNKPCDSDWAAQEYVAQAWYAKTQLDVCQPCSVPTTSTTSSAAPAGPVSMEWALTCAASTAEWDQKKSGMGGLWIARYAAFYSDEACTQRLSYDDPIASAQPWGECHAAECAMDPPFSYTRGKQCRDTGACGWCGDYSGGWVGIRLTKPAAVRCVKYQNGVAWGHVTNTVYLQHKLNGKWIVDSQPLNFSNDKFDCDTLSKSQERSQCVQLSNAGAYIRIAKAKA